MVTLDDIHPDIKAEFEHHLDLVRRVEVFGFRNEFLSPNLELYIHPINPEGILAFNPEFIDASDCARVAYRLGQDLEEKGFEVKYFATQSEFGSIQNYIEVLDPITKSWVQLDVTPWYEKINPGHAATKEHKNIQNEHLAYLNFSQNAVMLSVTRYKELFNEVYLYCTGFDLMEAQTSDEYVYEVILSSRTCESVTDSTHNELYIRFQVKAEKINEIKQLIETIKDDSVLDTLVEQEFVSKTYIQKQDGEYRELNSPDQFEGEFNMLNHMQEDLNMSYPVVLNLIRVISKGIPHYNHKDST